MKPSIILPTFAALPLLLNSCATLIQGKTDQVTFDSVQQGASVQVDGQTSKTPAILTISKKTTTASFTHPKFSSKMVEWKRNYQKGYVLLDIIATPGWGASGIATDTATGAIWDQPKSITYDFKTGEVVAGKFDGKTDPHASGMVKTKKRAARR